MVRTGAIGEWAAPISAGAVWFEAQRLVAAKQWRNENSVQNLAQLTQVVEAYEKMDQEFGIKNLRWVVHHVPEVNDDLLVAAEGARVRRRDGRVPLGHVEQADEVVGPAVPHDRRSRHPGRHPRRRRPHRAAESVAAHLLRDHGRELVGAARESGPAAQARRGAVASSRARTAGSCAWKTRSARSSPASSPTSRCSIATTSRFRTPTSRRFARCSRSLGGKVVHDSKVLKT